MFGKVRNGIEDYFYPDYFSVVCVENKKGIQKRHDKRNY